jgi:hypothetical protein
VRLWERVHGTLQTGSTSQWGQRSQLCTPITVTAAAAMLSFDGQCHREHGHVPRRSVVGGFVLIPPPSTCWPTGATQLTEMRRRASSLAAALLYCSVAACAPRYTAYSGMSPMPSWLLSSLRAQSAGHRIRGSVATPCGAGAEHTMAATSAPAADTVCCRALHLGDMMR